MPLRLLISDHLPPSGWDALRANPDVTASGPCASRAETLAALPSADALIVRSTTRVDAELLDAAPNLRAVARAGAPLDNVDLDEATRRGVMVIHVPDASRFAVTEHTFGMLLALARHIPQGYAAVQAGGWPRHELMGFELHGRTLGLLGFGRLGREVAARALAFGMRVLAYDPYVDLSFARERGVEMVGFDELLARADVLAPLTPLNDQTRRLLNAAAFRRMKPSAVLVNAVHAGLVDEAALLEALDQGLLSGAALDLFDQEPPGRESRLPRHPRVVAVPHLNQNTFESQAATGEQVVADVLDALRGADYRNVANLPFDDRTPYAAVRPYIHLAAKLGKLQGQLAQGWITRVEVELLGDRLRELARPVAAVLLSGMLLPVGGRPVNWVSAPAQAHAQGVVTAQAKGLVAQGDYPNLLACRIHWEGGFRTVAGALFANGEARLVQYDDFPIDAHPEGFLVILENDDVPGVIGKVGTHLGNAGINIGNWRYGREARRGRGVSFINVDARVPQAILLELEQHAEIHRARLVRL
jgi:D-3-phosphoglycerate dehydrogenase